MLIGITFNQHGGRMGMMYDPNDILVRCGQKRFWGPGTTII